MKNPFSKPFADKYIIVGIGVDDELPGRVAMYLNTELLLKTEIPNGKIGELMRDLVDVCEKHFGHTGKDKE